MNTCLCGNAAEASSTRCPRCAALHSLDLDLNATDDQIGNAYRLLVKVWHPDRFQTDRKLREAAEQRLKDVNSAFAFLTSPSTERGRPQPPGNASTYRASPEPAAAAEPDSTQSPAHETVSAAMPASGSRLRLWPMTKALLKVAMIAFALLLGRYLWIAFDLPDPTSGAVSKVYGYGKENLLKSLDAPKRRFVEAVEQDLQRLGLQKAAPAPLVTPQTAEAAPSATQAAPRKTASLRLDKTPSAQATILPYITVGSTRDEVLTQQGTPTASAQEKLVYGKSELYFKDGSVIGWRIDPASPIRVKLWPSSAVDPDLASYTVGSSKDVVLTVQGTPTAFTEDKFEYGRSDVYFRNNRVVSWKEDPDSAPLWAR